MRVVYFLILLLLLGALGVFALQNQEAITLKYLDWSVARPTSLQIAVVFLLGMVVGLVQRSLRRVSDHSSRSFQVSASCSGSTLLTSQVQCASLRRR